MAQKKNKRVVIALNLAKSDGRLKLAGLMRYLDSRHIRWDLRIKRGYEELSPRGVEELPAWDIDGIIFSWPVNNEDSKLVASNLSKLDIPLVVIDPGDCQAFRDRTHNLVIIKSSTDSIGVAAADFFVSQGSCRTYGYVPDVLNRDWSTQRGKAFKEALKARNSDCVFFQPSRQQMNDFDELRLWLRNLPKPAGILVAYDDRALTVIEACSAENISIPKDISILSVDNDDLVCENCIPTLSSLLPDNEKSGYAAGAMLSELMRTRSSKIHTLELPLKSIVHRQSTLPTSQSGKLVQKALAFIRRNSDNHINVTDVVNHLNVSRQLADLRFRQLLHTSIGKTIEFERMAHVAQMLIETDLTIKEIADKCGFPDQFHLMHLFKRHFGMTMGAYRKGNRI